MKNESMPVKALIGLMVVSLTTAPAELYANKSVRQSRTSHKNVNRNASRPKVQSSNVNAKRDVNVNRNVNVNQNVNVNRNVSVNQSTYINRGSTTARRHCDQR